MFIQSCYLLSCTDFVCQSLEEMGYHLSKHSNGFESIATTACLGSYTKLNKDILLNPNPHVNWCNSGRINCENNIFLFLALAGLNDERMSQQYYIADDGRWYLNCTEADTREDLDDFINLECDIPNSGMHWRKATVREILKHFKK